MFLGENRVYWRQKRRGTRPIKSHYHKPDLGRTWGENVFVRHFRGRIDFVTKGTESRWLNIWVWVPKREIKLLIEKGLGRGRGEEMNSYLTMLSLLPPPFSTQVTASTLD